MRIAVTSLLFNWPTQGGGNSHTVELAINLERAGHEVRHFIVQFERWGIGELRESPPYPVEVLTFELNDWHRSSIQCRLREAVGRFSPDVVLVTDSWNFKPFLAEAVSEFPYWLRFDAMEGLCPLNNIRLQNVFPSGFRQCPRHQLANPQECWECVATWSHTWGSLHQNERALSWAGLSMTDYRQSLLRSLELAAAVLVVNPLIGAAIEPYASRLRVVPGGVDLVRFDGCAAESSTSPPVILFAANPDERLKGFHTLHEACTALANRGVQFELCVTADPIGNVDRFTRRIGWQSRGELPKVLAAADLVAVPSECADAMPLVALESMAAGTPVVASRIGGLQFSVLDGHTGLLAEPTDVSDWATKLEALLSDCCLRRQMGLQARRWVESEFAWPKLMSRHYMTLLADLSASKRDQ